MGVQRSSSVFWRCNESQWASAPNALTNFVKGNHVLAAGENLMLIRKVAITMAVVSLCACGGGGSTEKTTGTPQSTVDTVNAENHRRGPSAPVATPGGTTPVTTTPGGTTPVTTTPGGTAPVAQTSFQSLTVLSDADGNPNDLSATYNITAEANVPVQVTTPTATWTTPMMRYNGMQLPPVIKAKRGTNVTVNFRNNLAEPTTIHWHGFKIPGSVDGGPDSPIAPGASFTYSFQLNQPAGSLWFHPHAEGVTATQVYNGLAGAFVVTDDITDMLEANKTLPSGNQDVPLLIQDRTFGAAAAGTNVRTLIYTSMMGMPMLGRDLLVNGVIEPTLNVETRQYRLRLYNGSNARTYDLRLSNGATFQVIGTDGGLLPAPVTTDRVILAAGERTEIVVDFRSIPVGSSVELVFPVSATQSVIATRFNVTTVAADDVTLYTALPPAAEINNRIPAALASATRSFVLNTTGGMMGRFAINGLLYNPARIDVLTTAGATEIWSISNTTGMAHPFHAHAIQWQVLDRNGVPASGVDLGWKDTVFVVPGETVRIIGTFDPVVSKGLFYYHCHILEHEEAGMMGTFFIQ